MNSPISGSWLLQRFDVMQAYPVPWHHSDGRTEVSSSGCPDCPAVLQRCHKHKSSQVCVHSSTWQILDSYIVAATVTVSSFLFVKSCSCGSLDLNQEMHPVRSKAGVSSHHHQLHISEKQKLGIHFVWLQVTECPILELHFPIFNLKTIQTECHAFPVDMAYKLAQNEHGKTA